MALWLQCGGDMWHCMLSCVSGFFFNVNVYGILGVALHHNAQYRIHCELTSNISASKPAGIVAVLV